MKTQSAEAKTKEREEKKKAIRKELQAMLTEQLSPEFSESRPRVETESVEVNEPMTDEAAKRVIEALLFASSKPLTGQEIRRVLKNVSVIKIQKLIEELKCEYDATGRSYAVYEIAGGYEIATRKEYAPWICKVELQKKARQATQSALETLAILAYKQPVTRAEIEDLRGVDSSGVLQNLVVRGLIKIVGKKEIPGRPFLYATTGQFLEHFGLRDIRALPNIDEIRQLVENSVRKDELLGTKKIVSVSENQDEIQETAVREESAETTQIEENRAEEGLIYNDG